MEVCLRALKESNKSSLDSYSVRNRVLLLIVSHIALRDCRLHIFSDNLSRNSCILQLSWSKMYGKEHRCNKTTFRQSLESSFYHGSSVFRLREEGGGGVGAGELKGTLGRCVPARLSNPDPIQCKNRTLQTIPCSAANTPLGQLRECLPPPPPPGSRGLW